MKKIFVLVLVFLLLLTSCTGKCSHEYTDDFDAVCNLCGEEREVASREYKVAITVDDGALVIGEQILYVKEGASATFKLELKDGYAFESSTDGTFNPTDSTLTVENVTRNVSVTVRTKEFADTSEYLYYFRGDAKDKTSIPDGTFIRGGSELTLMANSDDKAFAGWSFGNYLDDGGTLISKDRGLTITLDNRYSVSGIIRIYANYLDIGTLTYYANGGSIFSGNPNTSENKYYKADISSDSIRVEYSSVYTDVVKSASLFYDDGTFYRDGYVLKEYNTLPDGTGESYSLGAKLPFTIDKVYCIWSEATPADDFTFEPISLPLPSGVDSYKAPHWVSDGVMITSYTGDGECVTIPEYVMINGVRKYVTAIGEGAFYSKNLKSLVMSKYIIKVFDGAFVNCSLLNSIYYPDSIYYIGNGAFDEITYAALKNLYVNATLAPRYAYNSDGAFAIKLARLLFIQDRNRIIVLGGSSNYQGLASEYLEKLLDDEYKVVNFGTTRTTNGMIYLEAMGYYAKSTDIILYAPENSAYMMGENELYWKTLRDLEGMNNIFSHVDISGYTNVFGAFSDFNQNYRYKMKPTRYEQICECQYTNEYGDYQNAARADYVNDNKYIDTYYVTLNDKFKSRFDIMWNDKDQANHKDYNDPFDPTWCSVTDDYYTVPMNRALAIAKSSGARVYFAFCPTDSSKLVDGANTRAWADAYEKMILDSFDFDGLLGDVWDYMFDHRYFYDCAFHLNDYGRTYRTYQMYEDLCSVLEIDTVKGLYDCGTEFEGCLFEENSNGRPLYEVFPVTD